MRFLKNEMLHQKLMESKVLFLGLAFISLLFCSCKKDEVEQPEKEYPKEVTFYYGSDMVTYGVIKKEYYRNANGDTLKVPITKLWLDRNLGASRPASSWNDTLSYGDLFQWGRLPDGHQNRQSDTTFLLSATIIPGHDKFILTSYSPNLIYLFSNDWLKTSNDGLWNTSDNTNCPCPEGWRIPTLGELQMEMHSWDSVQYYGALNSELKWSANGYREIGGGLIMYQGWWSSVWSSTPSAAGKAHAWVIVGKQDTHPAEAFRSTGMGIRCIRDY